MPRRSRHIDSHEELNIWPAFTDLMANAFMILSLFLLLAILKSVVLKSDAEEIQGDLTQVQERLKERIKQVKKLNRQIDSLQDESRRKQNTITELKEQVDRLKSPPIIVIKDSGEYKFEKGKADLPLELRRKIGTEFVDRIEQYAKEYNGYVVEVIGHTDGQKNSNRYSNLDDILERDNISQVQPGSNADLGLMRSLAVVKVLRDIQKTGRLKGLEFRAYSAAQLSLPKGYSSPIDRNPDEPSRRRIEIRFTPPGVEK